MAVRAAGALVGSAAVVLVAFQIYPEFPVLGPMLLVLSTGILFRCTDAVEFYFHAQVRARSFVLARGAAAGLSALAVLFVAQRDSGLLAFAGIRAAELVLGALLVVVAYLAASNSPGLGRFNWTLARSLLRKSWPLTLSSFGALIYLKIDQAMLAAMVGPAEVGIYSVAAQLSEVWYFVPVAIATSVFPRLLESRQISAARYAADQQRLYDVLATLGLLSALTVTLLSPFIIDLLYGPRYAASAPVLSLHVWAAVFIFMRAALSKWLIAEELYLFSLLAHGVGALANVLLNMLLIPRFGAMGAAAATVASYSCASYFSLLMHPKTRPAFRMMTYALTAPARLVLPARMGIGRN
jgi:O-antigen/teichoic acid export membrane protein